jgi:hypothetical protein
MQTQQPLEQPQSKSEHQQEQQQLAEEKRSEQTESRQTPDEQQNQQQQANVQGTGDDDEGEDEEEDSESVISALSSLCTSLPDDRAKAALQRLLRSFLSTRMLKRIECFLFCFEQDIEIIMDAQPVKPDGSVR